MKKVCRPMYPIFRFIFSSHLLSSMVLCIFKPNLMRSSKFLMSLWKYADCDAGHSNIAIANIWYWHWGAWLTKRTISKEFSKTGLHEVIHIFARLLLTGRDNNIHKMLDFRTQSIFANAVKRRPSWSLSMQKSFLILSFQNLFRANLEKCYIA
jgi:hypothetical protein